MTSHIEGVFWFPKDCSRFVTWGSEINLYKYKEKTKDNATNSDFYLDICPEYIGVLEQSDNRRYQQDVPRCVSPSYQDFLLAAIGLQSGKVALYNFVPYAENNVEFIPRQSRLILGLSWNENEKNLLAMGYERNRSDYCISIWDTQAGNTKEISMIGLAETAHSLCWDKQSKLLYSGMSYKHIKLIDPRSSTNIVATTNTRAVHGLCQSPSGKFLASYTDNVVNIWDLRNIEKPLAQRQMQKQINNLSWCPTRSSVLCTLQRDSPFVHLLDLHWSNADDGGEPQSTKRYAAPFLSRLQSSNRSITIKNLSWHPMEMERMLALSGSGNITDFKVPQRVSVTFDNKNRLWGTNRNKIELLSQKGMDEPEDISQLMYRRALMDYGLVADIQSNGDLALNPNLKSVWKLLARLNRDDWQGLESKLVGSNSSSGMLGSTNSLGYTSSVQVIPWCDNNSGSIKIYRGDQRDAIIALCGWKCGWREDESSFATFIESISARGEYTRAAFIATVHLRIRYAIEILGKGAENHSTDSNIFRIAAIALSGFSLESASIWRSCAMAHSQIDDPYLRVIFSFLAPDNENYDSVCNEQGVTLSDRIAFACIFLNDQKLLDYIKMMVQICTERGDLNGLLLTGASEDGITLLQSHLDLTFDVQTVALIAVRCMPVDLLKDLRVEHWISTYRDLLDVWELWELRAQLDITLGLIRSPPKVSKSVFLMCSFCGKNVSSDLSKQDDLRGRAGTTHVNKLSSCPNCRKPLPRCSLCLLHMGTMTGGGQHTMGLAGSANSSVMKTRPFSKWFSWCQTCRHGGHTEHLAQWFAANNECPVTSCSCRCFAMDLTKNAILQSVGSA